MIRNESDLQRTREALAELEASMAALNRQKGAIHADRFALMAEPLVEHIRQLRSDIEDYIGLTSAANEMGFPDNDPVEPRSPSKPS